MADLLLIRPYQVAAQRRPRTEERPQATGQGSEGLTTQRPVTEEMTPLCKVEVTLPRVLGSRGMGRGGGVDEQAGVQPA
jgi:hypothetical protein